MASSATLNLLLQAIEQAQANNAAAEQRVVFHNVSWQTFKALLTEIGENRNSRLTYDRGILEIMTSLMPHARSNRLIERFIYVLVEEMGLNLTQIVDAEFIGSKSILDALY